MMRKKPQPISSSMRFLQARLPLGPKSFHPDRWGILHVQRKYGTEGKKFPIGK